METYADDWIKGPSLLKPSSIEEETTVIYIEGQKVYKGLFTPEWEKTVTYKGTYYPTKPFKASLKEVIFVFQTKKGRLLAITHRDYIENIFDKEDIQYYALYYTFSPQPQAVQIKK